MSLPHTEQTPDDPHKLPPARRRRAQRLLIPVTANEREAFIDALARRTSPSIEFYLLALLCGAILTAGIGFNSPALLVLGVLFAPMLTPLIGLGLGTVSGSIQFFTRSLLNLLAASILIFGLGLIGGALTNITPAPELSQAQLHAQLAWPNFIVLAVGSVLTTFGAVHHRKRTALASAALAYELFIPLSVAGFGLGSRQPHLWPDGLVVFGIHLAWAAILCSLTLFALGFRPLTLFGYTTGGVLALVGILAAIGLSAAGAAISAQFALPTPLPSATPSPSNTPTPSVTPSPTNTLPPPTATLPPTLTPSITPSPTITLPPSPTPVYARVNAPEEYGGAILRLEPGFHSRSITSALNGTLIIVLSEKATEADDGLWLHVRIPDGPEGWMLQSLIAIATPVPNW